MSLSDSHLTSPDLATDTAAALVAGIEIAGTQKLDEGGRFHAQLVPAGAQVQVHDLLALEQHLAENPPRKQGTVRVHDAESFVGYLSKHGMVASEVWANQAHRQLVGVINAHSESDTGVDEGLAGHSDHRVELELIHSPEWKTWLEHDKKWLNQVAFAEHLEDNAIDVVSTPGADSATMLEIAQSFYAAQSGAFRRSERLDNGAISLLWEETSQARAGETGDIEIPKQFTIAIPPFVGAEPVDIVARFRFRIREGQLSLSYALLNADTIQRQAFLGIVDHVRDTISQPVFLGRPA